MHFSISPCVKNLFLLYLKLIKGFSSSRFHSPTAIIEDKQCNFIKMVFHPGDPRLPIRRMRIIAPPLKLPLRLKWMWWSLLAVCRTQPCGTIIKIWPYLYCYCWIKKDDRLLVGQAEWAIAGRTNGNCLKAYGFCWSNQTRSVLGKRNRFLETGRRSARTHLLAVENPRRRGRLYLKCHVHY